MMRDSGYMMRDAKHENGSFFTKESGFGGFHFFDHFAELAESNVLDLTDAFAGHTKLFTNFFESFLRAAIETESSGEDGGFARIEGLDHFAQHARNSLAFEMLVRSIGAFVLDNFSEIIRIFIPNGSVE